MSCLEKNLLHSNLGVCGDNLLFAGYDTVELAKKYCEDNAPAYVNGVLNTIAHQLPDRECDAE